jgi:hypothetical protein
VHERGLAIGNRFLGELHCVIQGPVAEQLQGRREQKTTLKENLSVFRRNR